MRCNRIGCEKAATHEVELIVPTEDGSPSAKGPLGIFLCEGHADETDDWAFESVAWAIEVLMQNLGFPDPDATRAYAKPVPIKEVVLN